MMTQLTPQEQAERERLQRILDDLNGQIGQIEEILIKLLPLLGDGTAAALALELDIPSRHFVSPAQLEREK